ncbi:unnamed protein product [Moneuplotes crassus]|uniref:non-specific serine/threonine protein kinase n=1 Tax=Euplotes crassus TaxID=5936 RepID=A0AAD2CWI9_EUPCR|nr:unnamed protein product [Moneuplotes crassus]
MDAVKFILIFYSHIPQMEVQTPVRLPLKSQAKINIFSNDHIAWLNYLYHSNDDKNAHESYSIEPPSNSTLQSLTVECQLGQGAQGDIYLVKSDKSQKYALKACPKNKPLASSKSTEVLNEAKILSKLDNPFVIKLFEQFENENYKSFLIEFCQGGDLLYHMQRVLQQGQQFSEPSTKFYICCLILAIDHIHQQGFVYRDLKPENILLGEDGYPKLCDFGLAISQSELNFKTCRKQCGTREYFSPEIVKRDIYGKEVDWWSLGILTYELLFNETPFQDDNIFVANANIKTKEPSYFGRDDISPEMIDFISQLLSKDRNNRLGNNGIEDFIRHPWLDNVNWEDLEQKKYPCPFMIEGASSSETHFFLEEYTQKSLDIQLVKEIIKT